MTELLKELLNRINAHYARTSRRPRTVYVTIDQLRYLKTNDTYLADAYRYVAQGITFDQLLCAVLRVEDVVVIDRQTSIDGTDISA